MDRAASLTLKADKVGPLSVARVARMLEVLAAAKSGETLSSLSRALQAPKTSLLALLRGLEDVQFVDRHADGSYRIGRAAIELGMLLAARDLGELARPFLHDLVEATGETALLGTIGSEGDRAVYVAKCESRNPVRYTAPVGERRELYCTSIGKVLLAHLSDPQIEAYLAAENLRRFTANTVTAPDALRTELKAIREAGLAHTEDERVDGASAVAAPVFGVGGRLEAGLLVAGPTSRFSKRRQDHARAVAAAAARLSELLGHPGRGGPNPGEQSKAEAKHAA